MLISQEIILWSGFITKINKRKRSQRRKFCLTNMRFINFGDKKLKDVVIGFFAGSMVKRQIDVIKITHLTYSETSNEFVLHVPSEYDYRLTTLDKDSFIYFLLMIRENLGQPPLKLWFKPEINLGIFCTTEGMKEKKYPTQDPREMTAEAFRAYIDAKKLRIKSIAENTETLISRDGKKITENDFEVLRMLGKGAFGKVVLAQKRDDGEFYAVKILEKQALLKKDSLEQIKTERNILEMARHEFIVGLEYCFHSPSRVYFAMKFMQGGELF